MDAPPVVREHVEDTQNDNKECGGPLCLEANGYHGASGETEDGYEESSNAPTPLEDESEEKEDEEDTTSKEEAEQRRQSLDPT